MEHPEELEPRSNSTKRIITLVLLAVLAAGGWLAWQVFKPNVPDALSSEFVQIPTGSSLDEVVALLKNGNFIQDENAFRSFAGRMNYKGRPGRFKIEPGWSNYKLVRHLRSGPQAPVNVVLVNIRLPEDVAAKVARFIESDSASLMALFSDTTYLDSIGYTPQTLMSAFIPNTYQMFWNTSPKGFMARMLKEHDAFWKKDDREKKAAALNLTKEQVYTVASIVERETNANSEKARIAGLYLNRLAQQWPLQADPTLVFASKAWDSRDLAQYKSLDSPYNTYKYTGLPPGPISMAGIPGLDAVLNAEKHNYMFMCAIGDGSGLHAFAETLPAHNVNIERYKENLRKRGL